ncbi:hypothetical protein GCM10011344_24530 [Dokdonia pacifica]|uniref:Lipoprotein n=1 Tax=Dokdonia pacifica TaxID=1627892 RepID=A0A238WP12_9FLAO|nr:hypothetical protein [Dokdonia pacifica]GGG22844.1 hypothetical protein GCM10011344_24530 [Dokdonia pacifica]SNR48286.1 hypothetical protein SAMN06265376_1011284 [Dokdonia pacifica]
MKSKALILLTSVLLFSSCIVKSLQPFYNTEDLSYNEKLIGTWTDQKNDTWSVTSVKEEFAKGLKEGEKLSEDEKESFETYKDGYIINYTKKNKEVLFIAMPFKIEGQYFLDFIPYDFDSESINDLASQHLLKTHSVAKIELDDTNNISFLWLTEEHIKNLFKADKLRLKHEIVGPDEVLLLTASSKELSAFLKKYNASSIKDKWKSSDILKLTKKAI